MPLAHPTDLRGEGFILRPLADRDASSYAAAFVEDSALGRSLGMTGDPDEAAVRERVRRCGIAGLDAGGALELAIADPTTDELLGSVMVHSLDLDHRRCEVGFWLVPARRGNGVGVRAVACVIGWAFDVVDLLRVELTTTPDNRAAAATARRLRFTQEGVLRRRNIERAQRVDVVFFGLLREEWERR